MNKPSPVAGIMLAARGGSGELSAGAASAWPCSSLCPLPCPLPCCRSLLRFASWPEDADTVTESTGICRAARCALNPARSPPNAAADSGEDASTAACTPPPCRSARTETHPSAGSLKPASACCVPAWTQLAGPGAEPGAEPASIAANVSRAPVSPALEEPLAACVSSPMRPSPGFSADTGGAAAPANRIGAVACASSRARSAPDELRGRREPRGMLPSLTVTWVPINCGSAGGSAGGTSSGTTGGAGKTSCFALAAGRVAEATGPGTDNWSLPRKGPPGDGVSFGPGPAGSESSPAGAALAPSVLVPC